jgi:hypothetical protein
MNVSVCMSLYLASGANDSNTELGLIEPRHHILRRSRHRYYRELAVEGHRIHEVERTKSALPALTRAIPGSGYA